MSARRTFRDAKIYIAKADALEVGGNIIPQTLFANYGEAANAALADGAFFTADAAYTVTAVRLIHATAGTDAGAVSLDIKKQTGTQAPSAGVTVLSATHDLKSTINTVNNATLTATAADKDLAAGNRLSVDYSGVLTAVAGVSVTVTLKRR